MEISDLKPGSKSSELKLANAMMVAGLLLAIAASLGKVPFTPEELTTYLKNLMAQAALWSKAIFPYATAVYGFYLASRHRLKSKHIEAQKEVALKKIAAAPYKTMPPAVDVAGQRLD